MGLSDMRTNWVDIFKVKVTMRASLKHMIVSAVSSELMTLRQSNVGWS